MASVKQKTIVNALRMKGSNSTISLDECVELIGGNVYRNKSKHVGSVLSRAVNQGLLIRVKPGIFALPGYRPPNQLTEEA